MHQIITGAMHFRIAFKNLSRILFSTPLRKEILIRKSAIEFEVDNCVADINTETSHFLFKRLKVGFLNQTRNADAENKADSFDIWVMTM